MSHVESITLKALGTSSIKREHCLKQAIISGFRVSQGPFEIPCAIVLISWWPWFLILVVSLAQSPPPGGSPLTPGENTDKWWGDFLAIGAASSTGIAAVPGNLYVSHYLTIHFVPDKATDGDPAEDVEPWKARRFAPLISTGVVNSCPLQTINHVE